MEENRRELTACGFEIFEESLAAIAIRARQQLLAAAQDYTKEYLHLSHDLVGKEVVGPARVILAGHQPELFHPGVWYKNFTLGRVADECHAVAVNLIIDSDLCRTSSLKVPTGNVDDPRVEAVPFDVPADAEPYECREVRDSDLLATFAERGGDALGSLVQRPLLERFWPLVLERHRQQPLLGLCLAQGRHQLENQLAPQHPTLEIPQSLVCQLPEFRRFALKILADLPIWSSVHNQALAEYRSNHRIRNSAHPVPNLKTTSDGWYEAPFWIWSRADLTRRPLYAKRDGDDLVIADRCGFTCEFALSRGSDIEAALAKWDQLEQAGVKIRTRALTTTLVARLLLGDLFTHGIGGAKYDEVTDQIIQHYFGMAPPAYATVSATLRLPIDHPKLPDGEPPQHPPRSTRTAIPSR